MTHADLVGDESGVNIELAHFPAFSSKPSGTYEEISLREVIDRYIQIIE
jgi:hypothetical protein